MATRSKKARTQQASKQPPDEAHDYSLRERPPVRGLRRVEGGQARARRVASRTQRVRRDEARPKGRPDKKVTTRVTITRARSGAEQARDYLNQTQPLLLKILVGLSPGGQETTMGLDALADAANLVDVALLELNGAIKVLSEGEASS
jgi:hypothetical protein